MIEFKDPSSNERSATRSAADMHDDDSGNHQLQRNARNNTDEEREARDRKASQEMYARINNPNKFNSNDNIIRVRKESVDLKEVDF